MAKDNPTATIVQTWEEEVQTLSTTWNGIRDVEATEWRRSFDAIEKHFFDLQKKGLWVGGPNNFLAVLGRNRLELDHSNMLAWLLDPCMRHGLGTAFLRRFLGANCQDADVTESEMALCTIQREAPAKGGGRIDLLLRGPGFTVVVENKIDSPEAPGQCHYYYEAFAGEPGVHFAFLTPAGREPTTAAEDEIKSWVAISYSDIAELLDAALKETSDSVGGSARKVAEGYLTCLREEFNGTD